MALATSSEFTVTATATTGNVNGAGFNPSNSNMLTDLACDTNTGNTASPVVSSASYNFVAGDVGNWVYVKSGTNWTPGWYKIASVASNKATLNGTIGQAQVYAFGQKTPSTVVGCATVGTPTGGTFTIDYSQADTATISGRTDFAAVGASTSLTSATGGFTPVMVGNFYQQTTTGTGGFGVVGWYEIVSYTNATTLVLDRTPNSGTASVSCTGYIGGAGRLNGNEDAFLEMVPTGGSVWIKAGSYTVSAGITITSTNGTIDNPIHITGFTSIPGDWAPGMARPLLNMGGVSYTPGVYTLMTAIEGTGTGATVFTGNQTTVRWTYCKCTNTSTVANRSAWNTISYLFFCEGVCQNGYAFSHGGTAAVNRIFGCYFHDSLIGINQNSTASVVSFNTVANCTTAAIRNVATPGTSSYLYQNNTLYGRYSTPTGIGFDFNVATTGSIFLLNNIIAGFATGINCGAANKSINGMGNCFYGNTTDVTNYTKDITDYSLDPGFTDVSEITISNGTMTGGTAVLTSSGADFSSVEDNVDYFYLISHSGGTGTFIGMYLITAHTTTTLTFNNNAGTSGSATSIVGYVMTGHNLSVGTNLKALASYTVGAATSYLDIGGVQRQETGGSSTTVGWASQS